VQEPGAKFDPKAVRLTLEELQSFLNAPLTFRPMFGGVLAYMDGKPLMTLYDGGVGLKVKGALYDELCGVEGAAPVQYEPTDPPSKSYVRVPATWVHNNLTPDDPLVQWVIKAAEQVLASQAKPKGKRSTS